MPGQPGMFWQGVDVLGTTRLGNFGWTWRGQAGLGQVWQGEAWPPLSTSYGYAGGVMVTPDEKGWKVSVAMIVTLGVIVGLAAVAVPLVIRLVGL